MQSLNRQRRFYKITALSIMVAGSALLLFSTWDVLMPWAMCQETYMITDSGDVLARTQLPCIDPTYEIGQSSNDFIPVLLSICLMAFGGAIMGMIIRL